MSVPMQHPRLDVSLHHRRSSDFVVAAAPHGSVPYAPSPRHHIHHTRHHHLLQKRDEYDGAGGAGMPVMATPEEMRSYGIRGQDDRNQRNISSGSNGSNSSSSNSHPIRNGSPAPPSANHPSIMNSSSHARRHSDFAATTGKMSAGSPYGVGTRVRFDCRLAFVFCFAASVILLHNITIGQSVTLLVTATINKNISTSRLFFSTQ